VSEIVDFLRARLAEETAQQQDIWEQWHHKDCEAVPQVLYPGRETGTCDCGVPARVLADIEADRALIRDYVESEAALGVAPDMWDVGRVEGLRVALRTRAARYAKHEDYLEEWAP
jgi:hypothetical protein